MDIVEEIKNLSLDNSTIAVSTYELEDKFQETFSQIFSFESNQIKVVGSIEVPWFRTKDVLSVLNYSDNPATIKTFIHKNIPDKYKCELGGILQVNHPHIDSNEAKEIYINEGGLYRLIMRSNKPRAEKFQDFVQEILLPNIRKNITNKYNSKISVLETNLKTVIYQNNEIKLQNNDLLRQNQLALTRLEQMGITLEETKVQNDDMQEQITDLHEDLFDINHKLDRVLPDRNIDPKEVDLKHHYILFKNKEIDNEYIFVRGQDRYIKNKKNQYKTQFEITINQTKTPNPIDLVNRLKEKIQLINENNYSSKVDELKDSDFYQNSPPSEKRRLLNKVKKTNSKIIYRSTKIILEDYCEEDFLRLVRKLEEEKFDV